MEDQKPAVLAEPPVHANSVAHEAFQDRAKALEALHQTKENLGHVAAPIVVNGEVWTPGDLKSEETYRQVHGGQPSNETATGK